MHKNVEITNISGAALPTWLENANISDANISIDNKGVVTFLWGIWEGGIWEGGTWKGGIWEGGIWEGGKRLFVFSASDGWVRIAFARDGKLRIRAGCRLFSLSEARGHWKGYREDVYFLLGGVEEYCKKYNIEVD